MGTRNRDQLGNRIRLADGLDPTLVDLVYDPQTSGGLLIAVAPDRAEALRAAIEESEGACWRVGHVEAGGGIVEVRA